MSTAHRDMMPQPGYAASHAAGHAAGYAAGYAAGMAYQHNTEPQLADYTG